MNGGILMKLIRINQQQVHITSMTFKTLRRSLGQRSARSIEISWTRQLLNQRTNLNQNFYKDSVQSNY